MGDSKLSFFKEIWESLRVFWFFLRLRDFDLRSWFSNQIFRKQTWNYMDRPREYYANWNKSDRERQIPCDFTYMWNLKNKIIEQNSKLQIQMTNWWLPGREDWWDGCKGVGVKMYRLSYIKTAMGGVKYSIGNIVHSLVITVCGVRWMLDLLWWSFRKLCKCPITMCIPETNTIVYVNCNWKINIFLKNWGIQGQKIPFKCF